ncbi:MAG: pyridoxamine 5'-phosphate oxidase family protein [Aquaticitalea sp.]
MSKDNLYHDDAKKKIKDMAEDMDFAMLASNLKELPLHMIPMSTKKVDEQGNILFLSDKSSTHNNNIQKDPNIHLIYMNKGSMQFLNVYGTATINTDRKIIDEIYGKSDDAWFDGKDDPNITVISVRPTESYYWDPKNNKLVTLVKMGVGAITGNEPDLMDVGKIKS